MVNFILIVDEGQLAYGITRNLVCGAVKISLILYITNLILTDFPIRNLDASSQCNQQQV